MCPNLTATVRHNIVLFYQLKKEKNPVSHNRFLHHWQTPVSEEEAC